ncbi:hypothetical protein [Cerasicoccus arenae]|uniref:DUF2157 domain-containing protein n=1 Tax=Cerasicoccus arenae TaxID=424488 RepID=A0A8J3GDT9_9BACT|nr:hypothetical protein [Cerasicoccus arenae]MBK1859446.1 hypothetical protein [Cerasicoccus arenae]GHB94183.1 hypothetical protein GCM10007047_07310 [Cerasicoccus arenae]
MDTPINQPAQLPPPLPGQSAEADLQLELEPQGEASGESRTLWPSLPKLLRWLGAITLLSSALTFLVGNWMHTDELLRYGQFLGLTVILSACGWFCISRWRDDKGARTFFALGAALLPAHFAQLGAMLFAKMQGEATFNGKLRAFQFEALDWSILGPTLGIALLVLIPLTYVGFASMARPQARKLTLLYLLANATLLFTVRDPNAVALIGFALLGGLFWADRRFFASQGAMKTWDGIAMRTLLFTPFALLLGRNLVLHGGQSDLLISLMFTTLAGLFYVGIPRILQDNEYRGVPRIIALAPAFAAWFYITNALGWSGNDVWIPAKLLPCALIAVVMSTRMELMAAVTRRIAAFVAIGGALTQLLTVETPISSLIAVGTSLVVILGGYGMRERWIFRTGLTGLGLGLIYHLRYAADLYQGPWLWISLAATGATVLLGSSYLERYGRQGFDRVRTLHRKVSGWK